MERVATGKGKDRYRPTKQTENVIVVGGGYTSGSGVNTNQTPETEHEPSGPDEADEQATERATVKNVGVEGFQFVFSEDRRHLVNVFLSWDEVLDAQNYEIRVASI